MKGIRLSLLLFLIVFFCGCRREKIVTLELIATSDVHGNLFPFDFSDGKGAECGGSLARVSSYLGRERKNFGKNLLYFDLGDQLQGNALTYYDRTAEYNGSSLPAEVLNYLGCDASAAGNHDIEAGIPTLDRFASACKHPVLCANLFYSDTQVTYFDPYVILEREGIRIAVVGMTTPYVQCKLAPSVMEHLEVRGVEESSEVLLKYIKEKENPDVVIGLFHSGLEGGKEGDVFAENEALATAARVPGYDVVFYGHDHTPYCGKVADCNGDSVLLINPGPYADNVARVRLSIDIKGDSVISCHAEGMLCDISEEKSDSRLIDAYRDRIESVWHYQDSVVGKTDFDIDSREALCGPSYLTDYLNNAIMRGVNCEIALSSPYDAEFCIPAGNVTMRDLQKLYPYENQISAVILKGSDVDRILEYSSSMWMNTIKSDNDTLLNMVRTDTGYALKNTPFDFLAAYGVNYTVDVTKMPGDRVTIVSMSDGTPFDPDKSYRVGMSSFLASGGYVPFCNSLGIAAPALRRKEMFTTNADFRFHLITNFAVNTENGMAVHVERTGNWKLVPENIVQIALERDMNLLGY